MYKEKCSKFDDRLPFDLQGSDASKNDADALKVLKEYNYETRAWKIEIFGDSAIAAFIINCQYRKGDGEWKKVKNEQSFAQDVAL